MNELIQSIAKELNIKRIKSEEDNHYFCRVLYSALGLHCLLSAYNNSNDENNLITKIGLTSNINALYESWMKLNNNIKDYFSSEDTTIGRFIRTVYQETGYLITNENGIKLSNFGRTIKVGDSNLFYGFCNNIEQMNGLGIFTKDSINEVNSYKELILRDNLTFKEFIENNYEDDEFIDINFDYEKAKFFNPFSKFSNYQSWTSKMLDCYSLCCFDDNGIYYKCKKDDENILIKRMNEEDNGETFISKEYRRYYFALKAYYHNYSIATIRKIDADYYELKLSSKLPNREYYMLLLLSWPETNAYNEIVFICSKNVITIIKEMLNSLGIKTMEVSK